MKINQFPKHIFWSYRPDADVPEEVIIRRVLLYGEIKDMLLLTKIFGKEKIIPVLKKFDRRYKKRRFFVEKVILG